MVMLLNAVIVNAIVFDLIAVNTVEGVMVVILVATVLAVDYLNG